MMTEKEEEEHSFAETALGDHLHSRKVNARRKLRLHIVLLRRQIIQVAWKFRAEFLLILSPRVVQTFSFPEAAACCRVELASAAESVTNATR
jgi:hypothetical protein